MDIYPVVCYKVDEDGQTIEVSNTDQLTPIVGDTHDENNDESNGNVKCDKNETDVRPDNSENHINTERLPNIQCLDPGEPIDPGELRCVNTTSTGINKIEGERLIILRQRDKPEETNSSVTRLNTPILYPDEHEPKQILLRQERIMMTKRIKRIGCLFKCLALGMFGNTNSHKQIRQNIVMSIYNNWETHRDFAMQDSSTYSQKIENKDDYFVYMSQDGVQGGILELRVATAIFNIYIDLVNIREQTVQRFGACIKRKQNVKLFFDEVLCTFDFVDESATTKAAYKGKMSKLFQIVGTPVYLRRN